MTAVSISSSCAKTERQTCYGCLPRGDQKVRPTCAIPIFNVLITAFQRDQADREARFSRSCAPPTRPYCVNADFTYRSSRTVCDCYGRLVSVLYRSREYFQRFPAYEGQSGSKDRGDPEVLEYLRAHFYLDQRCADFQYLCRKPSASCHRAKLREFLCSDGTRGLSWCLCSSQLSLAYLQ